MRRSSVETRLTACVCTSPIAPVSRRRGAVCSRPDPQRDPAVRCCLTSALAPISKLGVEPRRFVVCGPGNRACRRGKAKQLETLRDASGWAARGARRWRRRHRCWQLAPWRQRPPPRRYQHPPKSSSRSRRYQRFAVVVALTRFSHRSRSHRSPLDAYAKELDESRLKPRTATTSSTSLRDSLTSCRQ